MDTQGYIREIRAKDEEELKKKSELLRESMGHAFATFVKESEMTAKQKRRMKVSLKDHRSTLGLRLTEIRNKPCACGSGKLNKNCHGR